MLCAAQSTETEGKSVNMEKVGLVRAIQHLHGHDFEIGTLVTDRHPQVRKYMRENMPQTKHYYDVWHVAKGELRIPVNTCRLAKLFCVLLTFSMFPLYFLFEQGFARRVRHLLRNEIVQPLVIGYTAYPIICIGVLIHLRALTTMVTSLQRSGCQSAITSKTSTLDTVFCFLNVCMTSCLTATGSNLVRL